MGRARPGSVTKTRHRKICKMAKGFRGRAKNCFVAAKPRVEKALQYAYRDRRVRKRDFRGLWIQRINAAVRPYGLTYSRFIGALIKQHILVDRKMLADLAVHNAQDFAMLVNQVVHAPSPAH
jgi:large subunit ribosomal protein L20